jgi:serine/threonine-protein kinase RsbW
MNDGFTLLDSLTIPSKFDQIARVEFFIDKVCAPYSHNEEVYGNVLIAVTEAVNNSIIHGNALNPNKFVEIDYFDSSSNFGFVIRDQGLGFDHDNLPDPTAPENLQVESGRGVFLMRHLADEVLYNDSGNQVSLIFNKHD